MLALSPLLSRTQTRYTLPLASAAIESRSLKKNAALLDGLVSWITAVGVLQEAPPSVERDTRTALRPLAVALPLSVPLAENASARATTTPLPRKATHGPDRES